MVRKAQKTGEAESPEIAKVAATIKRKDAKDIASTKHKGLPMKKEELTTEAKVDKGRSDYGKASIRNYRRMGPGHGDPGMFDPEGKRGKTIDKRREEHKARRGVKGAKVPAYKVESVAGYSIGGEIKKGVKRHKDAVKKKKERSGKAVPYAMLAQEYVPEEGYDHWRDKQIEKGTWKEPERTNPPRKMTKKELEKQAKNSQKALDIVKGNIRKKYGKGAIMGEENLSELSRSTLSSYIQKGARDIAGKANDASIKGMSGKRKEADKGYEKTAKRVAGVSKAAGKLALKGTVYDKSKNEEVVKEFVGTAVAGTAGAVSAKKGDKVRKAVGSGAGYAVGSKVGSKVGGAVGKAVGKATVPVVGGLVGKAVGSTVGGVAGGVVGAKTGNKLAGSSKKKEQKEEFIDEKVGGAGTLVRQGIKLGGKKGGRAVQKGTTAATAAGKDAAKSAAKGKPGAGKGEKIGATIGGIVGGTAGIAIPDGPAMVAGEIAGSIAGAKVGGKIGRQFDKKKPVKEGTKYGLYKGDGKPKGAMAAFAKKKEEKKPNPYGKRAKLKMLIKGFAEKNRMKSGNVAKEEKVCWKGYKRKPGTKRYAKGSCIKEGNKTWREFLEEGNRTARQLSKSKTQTTGNIAADRGNDEKKNRESRKGLEKDLKKKGIGYSKGVGEYKYKKDGKEGTKQEVSYQTTPAKGMSKRRFGKVMRRLGRKYDQESVITKKAGKSAQLHDTQSKQNKADKSFALGKSKPGKNPSKEGETSGTKVRSGKLPKKTKGAMHYGN